MQTQLKTRQCPIDSQHIISDTTLGKVLKKKAGIFETLIFPSGSKKIFFSQSKNGRVTMIAYQTSFPSDCYD